MGDRTRWPHLLWKRDASQLCTTQLVPGAFTDGAVCSEHFEKIAQHQSPAILVDSECLHRGAPTPATSWGSTLSIEFCTPSGWDAWEAFETGGTTKETSSGMDWRMLEFDGPSCPQVPFSGAAPLQLPKSSRSSDDGQE